MAEAQIRVTVQTEERMGAITALAHAVEKLAVALEAVPKVIVSDCRIQGSETGIIIDTSKDVDRTEIVRVEDGE